MATRSKHAVLALHWGAAIGNETLVRIVMEKGDGVVVRDTDENQTVLHLAPSKCDEDVIRLVMRKGANIIVQGDEITERSSLHWAIVRHHEALLRGLLEMGAPADIADYFGATTLHYAAAFWDEAPIELLVENGANLEATYNEEVRHAGGQTPLHQAVLNSNKLAIQQLLKAGANVNAQDVEEKTPLHMAAVKDDISLVKVLLRAGAYPDIDDANQNTAIDLAMERNNNNITMLLLCNTNSDFETVNEETALHIAASKGYKTIIGCLLDNGINIDARNSSGWTALDLAVQNQHYEIAKTLMYVGADLGSSLLDLVRENGSNGREMEDFIFQFAVDDEAFKIAIKSHRLGKRGR